MQHSVNGEPHQVSKEVSAKIVNMSLLGALLVISIHCGFSTNDTGLCRLIYEVFPGGYSRIAVPFFFLVSGYFLAAHISEIRWWQRETLKRVKSLMVPFLSWAFLYQVLFIPLSFYADIRAGRPFGTNISFLNGDALKVFGLVWDQWPVSVPLWFLRSLFLFVVVSPIVVWILRKIPRSWITVLWLAAIALQYSPDPGLGGWSGFCQHVFSIHGLMYFSIGMLARMEDIHYSSRKTAVFAAFIGGGLLVLNSVFSIFLPQVRIPCLIFAIPCLMYATWYFVPAMPIPHWLKGVSFPTYLAHSLFLGYWGIFSKNIGIDESIAKLIAWPLSFVGCIILANLIRRMAPRAFALLFGGR